MRWADTDIYGHMNNAVHYVLFDTGVQNFLIREGLLDLKQSETVFLVVSAGCTYFEEITFGDRLELGLFVNRLGTTSITYDLGLFRNGAQTPAAQGHFTHVNVDRETKTPMPLSSKAQTIFKKLT